MRYEYTVRIEPQEDGRYLATFPDVPGATTDGATVEEARAMAADALVAALNGYIRLGKAIPVPGKGRDRIAIPPVQAAKLALYEAMKTDKISNVDMGARLGVSEAAVRRLLDLDHRSHIDQVVNALAILGKRAVLEVA
jgi:antitoxin HicB